MLKPGDRIIDLKLETGDGKMVSPSDFAGKKVVLYFYSKDSTSGCTKQAQGFAEIYDALKAKGIEIVGVSRDSAASHRKFSEKYSLPFTLLSDPERLLIESSGVWQEKKMCGKVGMGVVRTTFILDENGVVEKVFEKVKADKSRNEIAAYFGI